MNGRKLGPENTQNRLRLSEKGSASQNTSKFFISSWGYKIQNRLTKWKQPVIGSIMTRSQDFRKRILFYAHFSARDINVLTNGG